MKKIKTFLSFFIPFLMLLLIIAVVGGFDNELLLISDLREQYFPFLFKYKNLLSGDGTLFYAFDFGFGNDFFNVFLYYLMSPINLLLSLVSYDNLYIFIILQVIFKISLCGTTMYLFLKYNFKNANNLLLFSTAYALSMAIVANYLNLMWLDTYILAPLILLGIDKIINEDKPLLYGITLFLSVFINYYMGFIVCVFCVMYFIYKFIINKPQKKVIKTFIIISLLAGLMTMFTHFTGLIGIVQNARDFNISNSDIATPLQFASSLLIGYDKEEFVLNLTNPRLYVGILVLFGLFLYFFNSKTPKREKLVSLVYLLIFASFMFVPQLNCIWHSFSEPNGFNFRYVFLIDIFVIYLSYIGFQNRTYISKTNYFLTFYLFAIICICAIFNSRFFSVFLSLFFFIVYFLIVKFANKKSEILICIVFLSELFFNTHIYFNHISIRTTEPSVSPEITSIVEKIKSNDDSLFYRIDFQKSEREIVNDNLLYNYNSVSMFNSFIPNNITDFLDKIGYSNGLNYYLYEPHHYIMNSIFGIKYYAQDTSVDKLIISSENYNIYENTNVLELGFIVSEKVKLGFDFDYLQYNTQEKILNLMNDNSDDILIELEAVKIGETEYEFEIKENQQIYMDFAVFVNEESNFNVYFNDDMVGNFFGTNGVYIYSNAVLPDDYKNSSKIIVKFEVIDGEISDLNFKVYTFDHEQFKKVIENLKGNQLQIVEFKDDYIKGSISGDGVLFTSILYSDNWKVYVDGEEVDTFAIFDTFLGVDISGEHMVEFKYEIDSFKYGFVVSSLSGMLFIFYIKKRCLK